MKNATPDPRTSLQLYMIAAAGAENTFSLCTATRGQHKTRFYPLPDWSYLLKAGQRYGTECT